jgi:hypothetical protein
MEAQELNYKIYLANKSDWWRYFIEYKSFVDFSFREIKGGEVTLLSLPLAFCIRHTLEIGYKMNLIELEKISDRNANIKYQGKEAHSISVLHEEFEVQMKMIFKKYSFEKKVIKQFNKLNKDLSSLKKILHNLDEFSYAFRYPVKNDGSTSNFLESSANINFKEVKGAYEKSMILLLHSTDVIAKIIDKSCPD